MSGPVEIQNLDLMLLVALATSAAAATAAEITARSAAAAGRSIFARPRNVHRQGAPSQFLAMQGLNRLLRLFRRAHRHETKPTRTTSRPVHHQVGFHHRAMGREGVLEVVFRNAEGKISYKQFCTHLFIYRPRLTLLYPDCSRLSGFKSSLNRVHLKISMPWKRQSIYQTKRTLRLLEKIASIKHHKNHDS